MAFQVSAGVDINEISLTGAIPAVSSSTGAFVGDFAWGPANKVTLLTGEDRLVSAFGKPKTAASTDFLVASQFLSYSGSLKVVRAINTASALNANDTGLTNILVANREAVDNNTVDLTTGGGVIARYPGVLGNSLKVVVINDTNWDPDDADPDIASVSTLFNQPAVGEIHIAVFDADGAFTASANSILETFTFVSTTAGAKTADGSDNYYASVINLTSSFIWIGDTGNLPAGTTTLSAGADGTLVVADILTGWDKFKALSVESSILIATTVVDSSAEAAQIAAYVAGISTTRKDSITTISPAKDDVVGATDPLTTVAAFKTSVNYTGSYATMDNNWKYIYNRYYDRYEWVPCNADVAGLMARTDATNDPWFSPAGYNRGNLKNVIKLAWDADERATRDEIYKLSINPIINELGIEPVLFGDKTMLSKPDAFDRINVRRLFIVLEKAIAVAAKYNLFEQNDTFTRAQFVAQVEPFLRDVAGRRGITDFNVVCDETNNTSEVIDGNRFVGDIYIKPPRSINFIALNFVAVRSGVEFSEVIGQF